MSKVEVLVGVEDAGKISEVARACEAAGMKVDQKMQGVGMISGTIDRANIGKIEKVAGVSYVEESQTLSSDD